MEGMSQREPAILHADIDAFYAAVEQLLDPSLRGRAMAVGESVILAASYEAKRFGVASGMATVHARERCPHLILVPGRFGEYRTLSRRVMDILGHYTPAIHQISIDEAFLDVRGSERLFGSPVSIAREIRRRVHAETGLTISIGMASTKHLAKIASQVAKPDGLVMVPEGEEHAFLDPLPVRLIWGVGPATEKRLTAAGIHTIGDLARDSPDRLAALLGTENGRRIHALALNEDRRRVATPHRQRSLGAQSAFTRAHPTPDLLTETLGHIADRISSRLRAERLAGRTVTVRVRFLHMRSVTRSLTLAEPVCTTLTLTEIAHVLVRQALDDNPDERLVTLLGVSVSKLDSEAPVQTELPVAPHTTDPNRPGSARSMARREVDRSMDAVRERFGRSAVGYATVRLSDRARVPDAFRELAEGDHTAER